MDMRLSEIMLSLQGEGKQTGKLTTFVRFYGCNLKCTYCDTLHAVEGDKYVNTDMDEILATVREIGAKNICLTGGEPLYREGIYDFIFKLEEEGFIVVIETNGAVELRDIRDRKFIYCMDVKCPSSGMQDLMNLDNLSILLPQDEVKFVISDRLDYEFAKDIIAKYPTKADIIFSPVFESDRTTNAGQLASWIIEDKLNGVRLGLQMHKLINIY